ncbi:MAG: hypothetical protein LUG44_07050 [Clostridiales bacterium]|nr:hypothetical protein [Clostridiales bacterium]
MLLMFSASATLFLREINFEKLAEKLHFFVGRPLAARRFRVGFLGGHGRPYRCADKKADFFACVQFKWL